MPSYNAYTVNYTLKDSVTGLPIQGSNVSVYDKDGNFIGWSLTDENGFASWNLTEYEINGTINYTNDCSDATGNINCSAPYNFVAEPLSVEPDCEPDFEWCMPSSVTDPLNDTVSIIVHAYQPYSYATFTLSSTHNLKDAGSYTGQNQFNYGISNLQVLNYSTGKRESIITFNFSDNIPAGQKIDNAKLCLNLSENNIDANEWLAVGAYLVHANWTVPVMDNHLWGNDINYGVVANSSYIWIVDAPDIAVYIYNRTTGMNISTKLLFTTGTQNNNPYGIDLVNNFIWITDTSKDEVYRYTNNVSNSSFSFDTAARGNTNPNGITHNDTHFFISDVGNDKIFIYNFSGFYIANFSTNVTNTNPYNIHYNGSSLLIPEYATKSVFIYSITGTYQGAITSQSLRLLFRGAPLNIWGDADEFIMGTNTNLFNFTHKFNQNPLFPMQWIEGTGSGSDNTIRGAYTYVKVPDGAFANIIPDYMLNFTRMTGVTVNKTNSTYCWTIASGAKYAYANGYKNLTYLLRGYRGNTNELTDALTFLSKEHAIVNSRPFLNITYSDLNATEKFNQTVFSPINNSNWNWTEYGINISIKVIGNRSSYAMYYSLNGGANISMGTAINGTILNYTLSGYDIPPGNHNLTITSTNNSVANSTFINFTVNYAYQLLNLTINSVNGNLTVSYPTETNVTGKSLCTGWLYINGTRLGGSPMYSVQDIQTLVNGTYNYTFVVNSPAGCYYTPQWKTWFLKVNLPSANVITFAVYSLYANNFTNSNPTENYTEQYYFNSSSMYSLWIKPCANADAVTNCQNGATRPAYSILNTGTVSIKIYMKLANAMPNTGITMCANSTGEAGVTDIVGVCRQGNLNETTWNYLANIPTTSRANVTVYANFSYTNGGIYSNINTVNSTS